MSDEDLAERRRQLARIERTQFHASLSSMTFALHSARRENPPLEEARWAVEKEMKRRGMRPPSQDL